MSTYLGKMISSLTVADGDRLLKGLSTRDPNMVHLSMSGNRGVLLVVLEPIKNVVQHR